MNLSDLIPGGQDRSTDCTHEWLTNPVPVRDGGGFPARRLECTDDNPLCDFGAVSGDKSCTFHVALCFNVAEQRFACSPTDVSTVQFRQPNEEHPQNASDLANRDALEAALATLKGVVRGMCENSGPQHAQPCTGNSACDSTPGRGDGVCKGRQVAFLPPLTARTTCTGFVDIQVPLRRSGDIRGYKTLWLRTMPSNDPVTGARRPVDADRLRLICKPKP